MLPAAYCRIDRYDHDDGKSGFSTIRLRKRPRRDLQYPSLLRGLAEMRQRRHSMGRRQAGFLFLRFKAQIRKLRPPKLSRRTSTGESTEQPSPLSKPILSVTCS